MGQTPPFQQQGKTAEARQKEAQEEALKLDTTKVGVAAAKAMEGIEKYVESGDIPDDSVVGACVLVVALDHATPDDMPDRDRLRDVATQIFVFAEPEELYIQTGLLRLGIENSVRDED